MEERPSVFLTSPYTTEVGDTLRASVTDELAPSRCQSVIFQFIDLALNRTENNQMNLLMCFVVSPSAFLQGATLN